jgi:DNA polymerase-3 subunit alpha
MDIITQNKRKSSAEYDTIPTFEDYDLQIKGLRLPEVELTKDDYRLANVKEGTGSEEFLTSLARSSLKAMGFEDPKYTERLEYELDVYRKTGFTDYIILIWDILNFCRKNSIPVGKGRGSCPASLVLYAIGVTGIDPIEYELYFERFVSETRAKSEIIDGVRYIDGLMAPDVDIDIAHEHRHRVVEYLFSKYPNKCCKLSTTSTLKGRAVIKECAKIVGCYSNDVAEELAKAVPELFGKVYNVEESYKDSKKIKEFFDENPKVFDIAKKIEGLIKNKSSHASGYLVAYDDKILKEVIPLELNKEGDLISSFDMNYAQILCIKVDLLGLQDLTLLARVCDRIGIKYDEIDVENPEIYEHYQKEMPTPYGLFQIGADCNFRVLNKVKPKNLSQLSSVIALARPGALAYVDQFARFVETGEFESVHEYFDETLKETGSIPTYQESLLKMANKVGFSLAESEILRRATAKKSQEKTKEWQEKIANKIKENNLDPKIGEVLWKVASESANYSFNKCLKKSSLVNTEEGNKKLEDVKVGDKIKAYDVSSEQDSWVTVLDKIENKAELFKVTLEDGRQINCSLNHKLLCKDMIMRSVVDIITEGHEVF